MTSNKFFVPAATMLTGLFAWIVFLVLHEVVGGIFEQSVWLGAGLCLVVGGLILYSAISCRKADGPRVGSFVRIGFLVVMAAVTYWRIGIFAAAMLAVVATVILLLALMSKD
jgi:energy-converting hydrogenase Eha subunit C